MLRTTLVRGTRLPSAPRLPPHCSTFTQWVARATTPTITRPLSSAAAPASPFVLLCHVRVAPGMLDEHLTWAREIDSIVEDSECSPASVVCELPSVS